MAKTEKNRPSPRRRKTTIVGREGTIPFGINSKVRVVILEDPRPVGYKGRNLVRVRFANWEPDEDPPSSFEIPADDLDLIPSR